MDRARDRTVFRAGILLLVAGLVLNEWWVEAILTHDGSLSPAGRSAIRLLEAFLGLLGIGHLLMARSAFILRLDLALGFALFALFLSEVALRLQPALINDSFAARVDPARKALDGLFYDGLLCAGKVVRLFRPGHVARLEYRGNRWRHRTDQHGLRGEGERERADVLVLGDSFLYGLGLDVDRTVPAVLERETGWTVANLARPGDCAFEQVHLLNHYIGQLKPRTVVHFFYQNDIEDAAGRLSAADMRAFLETPLGSLPACEERPVPAVDPSQRSALRMASPYLLLAVHEVAVGRRLGRARDTRERLPEREGDLTWKFTIRAIEHMQQICAAGHAQLILVPILPSAERADHEILASTAKRLGIVFVDTWASLRLGDGSSGYYLPGDGHFTELGATAVARQVARYLPPVDRR